MNRNLLAALSIALLTTGAFAQTGGTSSGGATGAMTGGVTGGATLSAPQNLPERRPLGEPEVVATFPELMLTGVTVSEDGRVFVNFPRWEGGVPTTVAEVIDGEVVPYPDAETNQLDESAPLEHFISVQSVVIGPDGRLWVLDTGRPLFQTPPLGPKLVAVDLGTNEVVQTVSFADSPAILNTTYLNDVRFDLRKGEAGLAFITDSSSSGPNAIIVVDLASGEAWRQLEGHPSVQAEPDFLPLVEGQTLLSNPGDAPASYLNTGADGIAITPDRLFYRALAGRHLYSVPLDALAERHIEPQALASMVTDYGDLGFASDGLESDDAGRIYLTDYEHGAVHRFSPDAPLAERFETLLHTDQVIWPDTLDLIGGALYLTVNQLNRQPSYQNGEDLREPPYVLFRLSVDAAPVQLR